MALYTCGAEGGVVSLQKNDAHNVVANVTLSLELLWVVFLVRKLR
jgi:hypothetical protein